MCGLCFIYGSLSETITSDALQNMVHSLEHRGPDAQHLVIRKHAALGHTRLRIVDIKTGDQPMVSIDGRYAIIYNGEIYNYRELRRSLQNQGVQFTTYSDTEVLLNMYIIYGENCLAYLRGMFSFVVHDNITGQLFMARDRLGIKPLFYHWDGSRLIGASEIKAIFASGLIEPEFNMDSIVNHFKYQFSVAPYTMFKNIFELEPGYTISISPGQNLRIKQYWDLYFPEQGQEESLQEKDWENKFESALDGAVVSHMTGDVSIGAYLSGGIDSATTTYLLNRHSDNQLQTFTIAFTNKSNDESSIAKQIADYFAVANSQLLVDDEAPGGFLGLLTDSIYHLEQPQRVAVDIPYFMLSEFVQQNKYKVVFSGDGADEILAGYDCYRQGNIRIWGNARDKEQPRKQYYLQEFTNTFAKDFLTLLSYMHEPKRQQQTMDEYGCYPAWFDIWHILDDVSEHLFSEQILDQVSPKRQIEQLIERLKPNISNRHPLNQSLYLEAKTRLPGWILWKSDRLSMAHGVEARVPYLDHLLVELTAQLPPQLKLRGLDEKYILKNIMRKHMPQHPQQFKKRPFYTPIKPWFFTREKIQELDRYLSQSAIEKVGIFNWTRVAIMLEQIIAMNEAATVDEDYALMKLEWGLMLVLTVQILHWLFIQKHAPCFKLR